MATIGLKNLHFFPIVEDTEEKTTYGEGIKIGRAMQAGVEPQFNSSDLRADDGVVETANARGATNVTVQTDDISKKAQSVILGKKINADGVLIDSDDDKPPYGAIAFCSEKANGKYRYVVLYKGKFTPPQQNYETKQETPEFQTPTIEGRFLRRNSDNRHGAQVDEDDEDIGESIIDNWFEEPYEDTGETGGGGVEG